jgi:general secretion pathway protein B
MSFILDALKKSETDRARQSGPALYEVKVPPPRHGLPLWALVVVLLLAVNLAIGMWMLLRHAPRTAADGARDSAAAAPGSNSVAPPAAAAAAVPAQPLAGPPATLPTQTVGAQQPPMPSAGTMPAGAEAPAGAATGAAHEPAAAGARESANPEDYEPAAPAAPPVQGAESHVRRGTADGVPLYQEVATQQGGSLPQLRLDLHVYAAQPSQRFVMINMRKLREGESTPEGARVESITPDGAVLSYNGARFLLTQ